VLAEDEDERIGRRAAPGLTQRDARHAASLGPEVGPRAALAEVERPVDDPESRVDLQGPRLHAEPPRLARPPGVPVDDHRANAAPTELVGEHEPGRSGPDDQDIGVHRLLATASREVPQSFAMMRFPNSWSPARRPSGSNAGGGSVSRATPMSS